MLAPHLDFVLRICAAFVAGLLLGLERESHGRAAGLRTVVLVSVAAALAMALSDVFYHASAGTTGWRPDPARLAAGILTGMGFIGGGVILRLGNLVRGVTTASVLWLATVIGLCFGGGQFVQGTAGLVLGMAVLCLLPWLEEHIQNDWYGQVSITVSLDGASVEELSAALEQCAVRVKSVELDHDLGRQRRKIRFQLKFKRHNLVELATRTTQCALKCPGVLRAVWC